MVFCCSSGKPGQCGIPGANSCVRSMNFLLTRTFCSSSNDNSGVGSRPWASEPNQTRPTKIPRVNTNLVHGVVTSTLLTHCAKRSQQLRTSCDNRRPFFVIRQIHFSSIGLFTSVRLEFDEAATQQRTNVVPSMKMNNSRESTC